MLPPSKENICAVIVTYHPDSHLPDRIAQIARQVARIVIVDNGSADAIRGMLHSLAQQYNVHLILNQQNLGVATALNQGLRWAEEANYSWALMLDQDSVVKSFLTAALCEIFTEINPENHVAVIGSNFISKNSRRIFFKLRTKKHSSWSECNSVITAGSLISLSAYEAIGPFREDFFIDQIDHEYCLRAIKKGFKIIIALKLLVEQTFGIPDERFFFCKKIFIAHYAPVRYYYISRNTLILCREYFQEEPQLMLKLISRLISLYIAFLLYGDNRHQKIKNTIKGLYDGLTYKIR